MSLFAEGSAGRSGRGDPISEDESAGRTEAIHTAAARHTHTHRAAAHTHPTTAAAAPGRAERQPETEGTQLHTDTHT